MQAHWPTAANSISLRYNELNADIKDRDSTHSANAVNEPNWNQGRQEIRDSVEPRQEKRDVPAQTDGLLEDDRCI